MNELLFEYKVKVSYGLDLKEFSFYATIEIEEFLNRNSIDYVRNCTDTVESRLFKENKRLNNTIKEVREYIEKFLYEHIIDDLPDEESKFETKDGVPIPNAKEQLLNILDKGSDKE